MSTGLDLTRMSLLDALNLALVLSGKNIDHVAAEMGWQPSNARRIFSSDDYWPTLPNLARLCVVLGNTILLDWLATQAEAGGCRLAFEALDAKGLLLSMGDMFKELGEAAAECRKALEGDQSISQAEARRLVRKLRDLAASVLRAISGLHPTAAPAED